MKNAYLKKYTLEQRIAMLEEEIAELKRQVGDPRQRDCRTTNRDIYRLSMRLR